MSSVTAKKEIWVLCELRQHIPCKSTLEVLGKASELAVDLQANVSALITEDIPDHICKDLFCYGINKVYICPCSADVHSMVQAVASLVKKYRPYIFLCAATIAGRSIAPQIAALLKTGLTADCTGLSITKDGLLLQTRPAFGGTLTANILCRDARPQMATVRPGVFSIPKNKMGRTGHIIREPAPLFESLIKLLKTTPIKQQNRISEADIIVAGGMGMGSKNGFKRIHRMADLLGGMVGASRAAVNIGFAKYEHQVGQTGAIVRPKLYIACGISGAVQHLAGMSGSRYIIAINKDKNAPIFDYSDIAVIGDVIEILDQLLLNLPKIL